MRAILSLFLFLEDPLSPSPTQVGSERGRAFFLFSTFPLLRHIRMNYEEAVPFSFANGGGRGKKFSPSLSFGTFFSPIPC